MKKFKRIYVDMDGVIADFDKHAEELLGESFTSYEEKHGAQHAWEDLWVADFEFFRNLPSKEGALALMQLVYKHAESVCILTSPCRTNREMCIGQKLQWLHRLWFSLCGDEKIGVIFEKIKEAYAGPGRLLIDDRIANVVKFRNAGGAGFVYRGKQDLDNLQRYLNENA